MSDRTCPKHPDQDTMVPCFGCGRYFCRVCQPTKGAGQYCDTCYKESLAELGEKESEADRRKFYRLREFVRTGYVPRKVKVERSAPESAAAGPAAPDDAAAQVTAREGLSVTGREAGRAVRPAEAAPVAQAAAPVVPAGDKAPQRARREKREGPGRVRRAWSRVCKAARETFPITLVKREKLEGPPQVFSSWLAVLLIIIGGALLWTLAVVLWRSRNPVLYILIAIIMSLAIAYATGSKFGVQVGVVGACLAVLALVGGELIVLVLFKLKVIRTLDITPVNEYWIKFNKSGTFYPDYLQKLLLFKLLPAAAAAFLVGWWPLKKRFGWKGFSRAVKKPEAVGEAELSR